MEQSQLLSYNGSTIFWNRYKYLQQLPHLTTTSTMRCGPCFMCCTRLLYCERLRSSSRSQSGLVFSAFAAMYTAISTSERALFFGFLMAGMTFTLRGFSPRDLRDFLRLTGGVLLPGGLSASWSTAAENKHRVRGYSNKKKLHGDLVMKCVCVRARVN